MMRLLATAALGALAAGSAGAATFATLSGEAPLVIAHRGASGYLPEHTLAGYELAIRMGADVVEPDLQVTSDGELVAMHDSTLTRTTNVENLFAPRNGGYAVSDFTLAEIKTLTVEPTASTASTSYPGFTPSMADPFKVPTFAEVLDFVRGYNQAKTANIGVYPEAKTPNTTAMNQEIVAKMKTYGFAARSQNSFIQTFSHAGALELNAMQDVAGIDNAIAALGYVGLVDGQYFVYDAIVGELNSLDDLAGFADGVGVSLGYDMSPAFIAAAHDAGLAVHGWTFNKPDPDEADALYRYWIDAGIDGIFTNYTDSAVATLASYDEVSNVPLPAGLPLLVAGLGALGLLRRRAA